MCIKVANWKQNYWGKSMQDNDPGIGLGTVVEVRVNPTNVVLRHLLVYWMHLKKKYSRTTRKVQNFFSVFYSFSHAIVSLTNTVLTGLWRSNSSKRVLILRWWDTATSVELHKCISLPHSHHRGCARSLHLSGQWCHNLISSGKNVQNTRIVINIHMPYLFFINVPFRSSCRQQILYYALMCNK